MISETETISSTELEQWTGIGDRQMRNLATKGHFPPPKNSQWQFAATIKGYIKYKNALEVKHGELAHAKLFREQQKGRKDKVNADEAEGRVIDVETMRRQVTRFVMTVKGRMLSIPKRVGQRFALERDALEIEQRLESEIRDSIQGANGFKFGTIECPECKAHVDL